MNGHAAKFSWLGALPWIVTLVSALALLQVTGAVNWLRLGADRRPVAAITYTVACNDWDFYRQRAQVFHRATRARTDSGGTSFVTEAGTPIRLSPAVPCLIVRE